MESWHVLGGRQFGGADQFYVRLIEALNERDRHRVVAINRPGSPVAAALQGRVPQHHLPFADKWDRYTTWRLRRWLRSRQPDIVQTYMGRASRLTRVPRRARTTHVCRLGGYYKIDGYYEHADAWIGNTRGVCDYLVRQGLPARAVYHIGNFVPEREPPRDAAARTALLRRHTVPDDALILFTLGRFIDIKGFDDLLRALARLPASVHNRPLHLFIAGDGPLRESLHTLCRELALDARVHWLGWCERPGEWFDVADIVVCPSRHETLGNVILEAWSYRKPVVATRTPGALELIEADETGVLVPTEDPGGLAAGLQRVLAADAAERERIASAGEQVLHHRHSRAAVVSAYEDLYRVIRQKRPV